MIGKITKQELHPSLLKEYEQVKNEATDAYNRQCVIISSIEPVDVDNGTMWYDLTEARLFIKYNKEWLPVCHGHSGGPVEPIPPKEVEINYKVLNYMVTVSKPVDKVKIHDSIKYQKGIFKVFANGLLLKEDLDYVINNGYIQRKDSKKWNEESKGRTEFYLLSIIDDEDEGYIEFLHEHILITNKDKEVKLTNKAKEILNDPNSVLLVNKVKLKDDQYSVKGDILTNKDGKWGDNNKIHLEFITFKVDNTKLNKKSNQSKIVKLNAKKDDPLTIEYDQDGFKGTLLKETIKESKGAALTKKVDKQDKEYYSDSEGYSGKLEKYLYMMGETKSIIDTVVVPAKESDPDTMEYNKDGFKGTLKKIPSRYGPTDYEYRGDVVKNTKKPDVYKYRGTVTKDTGEYIYKGVVKAENTIKKAPTIKKHILKNKEATDSIPIPFVYSNDNHYEVIANGVFIYPLDYSFTDNFIKKQKGKWDKGTKFCILEIDDVNVHNVYTTGPMEEITVIK